METVESSRNLKSFQATKRKRNSRSRDRGFQPNFKINSKVDGSCL